MLESLESIILFNGEPCLVQKAKVPDALSANKFAISIFEVFAFFDVHYCGSVLRGGNFISSDDTLFIVDGIPHSVENSPKAVSHEYFSLPYLEKRALFSILLAMYVKDGEDICL